MTAIQTIKQAIADKRKFVIGMATAGTIALSSAAGVSALSTNNNDVNQNNDRTYSSSSQSDVSGMLHINGGLGLQGTNGYTYRQGGSDASQMLQGSQNDSLTGNISIAGGVVAHNNNTSDRSTGNASDKSTGDSSSSATGSANLDANASAGESSAQKQAISDTSNGSQDSEFSSSQSGSANLDLDLDLGLQGSSSNTSSNHYDNNRNDGLLGGLGL